MEKVIFLFLRRMRMPLAMLIISYAVSITGLVLIPGVDEQGREWHYDFFHAFYFISFVGPTIGFGEIPYALVPAQRMWVTFALYFTVISWLFAIGKIFALMQEPAFVRAITEARFIRAVRAIHEPYYIICGYGETGSLLVRALASRNVQCVVIERNPEHIADLQLEELPLDIPCFCGDASVAQHLKEAGVRLDQCKGVMAMTDCDKTNVKIAVTSKLLRPKLLVVCRAASREAADNMASFETDVIINPFESFAEHMGMALRAPHVHLLHRWLGSLPGRPLSPAVYPPRGVWVICGFGRFGQAMARYLSAEGIEVSVIESDAKRLQGLSAPPKQVVIGSATDPEPLHEAGVEQAAGIVAGTNNDANNLSIIMTARVMNPQIFQVARQNKRADSEIFAAAQLDLGMEPSRVIVWRLLELISEELLPQFLAEARRQNDDWARDLLDRIRQMTDGKTPQTWGLRLDRDSAPGMIRLAEMGISIRLQDLVLEPQQRKSRLPALALLLVRDGEPVLLPADETELKPGDRLLWTAKLGFKDRLAWLLHNPDQLQYLMDGVQRPSGTLGRWWLSRRQRVASAASQKAG